MIKDLSELKNLEFGESEGNYLEQVYLQALRELDNSNLKYDYNLIFDK